MSNVTISVPDDLLREARHLAVDEGISLSRYVARSLELRVEGARSYHAARERQLHLLGVGIDLGSEAHTPSTREGLHER